jgi:hypothetical protein
MKKIIFIGGARDYHVIDWYRTVKEICGNKEVVFVTDSIEGEGFEKLINEADRVVKLLNIDWLLFRNQSRYGNIWRNFVKLIFIPLQVMRLAAIAKKNRDAVFHAMPMYYMFLCRLARIPYIGTPQGSEVLVRPDRSKMYKYFATKALLAAKNVTVDSVNMQNKIIQLCGKESTVIQNGIDVEAISHEVMNSRKRENVVSIRGFTPLYRINEIFDGRASSLQKPQLHLFYPFWEDTYRTTVSKRFELGDCDLERLSRQKMFELLTSTLLAISIPISDSSPRSVYEAIFCGCCVAVTYNPWIDALPECMKSRLFIVDLKDNLWFEKAIEQAKYITTNDYKPSEEALELFDKKRTMQKMVDLFYNNEKN